MGTVTTKEVVAFVCVCVCVYACMHVVCKG